MALVLSLSNGLVGQLGLPVPMGARQLPAERSGEDTGRLWAQAGRLYCKCFVSVQQKRSLHTILGCIALYSRCFYYAVLAINDNSYRILVDGSSEHSLNLHLF